MAAERLPWFPCYPSKLLGALAGMKPSEGYVYWVVCLRIYEVGGPCRDTIDVLARRTGLSRRHVSDAIDLCFQAGRLIRQDDGIINPFAVEILAEAKSLLQKRSNAGKKGGNQSAEKRKQKQQTTPSNGSDLLQASVQQSPTHLHLHKQEQRKEERKKDAANAAPLFENQEPVAAVNGNGHQPASDEKSQFYARARAVLGESSGGMATNLLKAKEGNVALARAAIETASTKGGGAKQYIGRIIHGASAPPNEGWDPRL